ncbi:MAG: HNH endonuclease signature motif containing protein [Candidatus Nanopelagicales bacterium]
MRRYVRTRDRHCRFPGCIRPARNCDLDHIVPWPAGPTDADNLQPLCRYHHRIKTHSGWRVERGPDNTTIWISPRGKRYTSCPDDP